MSFRDFRWQILFRILLITAGIFGLLHFSYIEVNYIRIFFISLFIIFVLIELVHFVNKSNRDTANFLQAIIHNDFTLKYSAMKKGKSFRDLYDTFNRVNEKFVEASQNEAQEYNYITNLIQQLGVGIISFDDKERIHLINDALKKLLAKKEIVNLQAIKGINRELYDCLVSGQSKVLKTTLAGKLYQLSVNTSEFRLRQNRYRIVSIQDIKGELDQNEMTAWQKLISVLTHEIMNSVAPITSLSGTLNMMVNQSQNSGTPLSPDQLRSLHDGLDAIENRSDGLMNFTEAYRSLTRIPLPNIKPVEGPLYFQRIISLFLPTLSGSKIQFDYTLPKEDFTLQIDPDLMEQVFINLLKNAKEAVSGESGRIRLTVSTNGTPDAKSTHITIEDNGPGIAANIADKVFIPFYTTKSSGSGIGLSLVKQIVLLHRGEIDFNTPTTKGGTEFSVRL